MKILASIALIAAIAGCDNTPSKLEGKATGGKPAAAEAGGSGGGKVSELLAIAKRLDERLAKFEELHRPSGTGSELERLHRIEVGLARREEALGFLEMAYTQQKAQQEAKEANEMDPNGVFAVDISKALAAGQVEGPNSALVTIVEAWDFA